MSYDTKTLYDLLPSFWKLRDLAAGSTPGTDGLPRSPLHSVLEAIGQELAGLEENLDQLYDDLFIETSADWAVPYIGDLIGYRSLHGVAPRVGSPRAEVADTIALRRRKGTAMVLEQLAQDVTGWPANVVEYFQILSISQSMRHLRPGRGGTADLRHSTELIRLGGPFDPLAHSVEVRRIASRRGRYNIPDIGIFLWRLRPRPLRQSLATSVDGQRMRFHPLGIDASLYLRGRQQQDLSSLAHPGEMPDAIGRRFLEAHLDEIYGEHGSLQLWVDGADAVPAGKQPSQLLCVCNLSDLDPSLSDAGGWAHVPGAGQRIAIDPWLGRIALPPELSGASVRTFFHWAFAAELGGADYARAASFAAFPKPPTVVRVPVDQPSVSAALTFLDTLSNADRANAVVEIASNDVFAETPTISVDMDRRLEIRAADGFLPHLLLGGDLSVVGQKGAHISLNGLLISGGRLLLSGTPDAFDLVHSTLVPGQRLSPEGNPLQPHTASFVAVAPGFDPNVDRTIDIRIDHCIVGPLQLPADGFRLVVSDSFVDSPDRHPTTAIAALAASADGVLPGPPSTLVRTTVWGKVHLQEVDLVSDSLFSQPVTVDRKQTGCVRFSYCPPSSVLPRSFRCQPAEAVGEEWNRVQAAQGGVALSAAQRDAARQLVENRLRPDFLEDRFGKPSYGLLGESTATEIATGASDGAEMGAFHDLYQAQKESNLRIRLEEYLRFSLEAGVFHAT